MTSHRPPLRAALAGALLLAAHAARAGTGLVYVAGEKDNAITLVDAKTLAVAGSIPTCARPRHLQLLPGGTRLLVACGDAGQADTVDLATRRVVDSSPLGHDPEALDISADGRLAYVSAEDDGALSIVDLAAKKEAGRVALGPEPEGVKLSPDGRRVYVTSEVAGVVYAIATAT
ncbi:MAG TPA: hypothetical protein VES00_20240, partial [Burkholderiaceae bacterium]|nr:hypothetical protein [Burkholderiaceae bacterium]